MREPLNLTRRNMLIRGGKAAAGLAMIPSFLPVGVFDIANDEKVIPWEDQPPEAQMPDMNLFNWEELDSWITPTEKFFRAVHYGIPNIDPDSFKLEINGLVKTPRSFTLEEIKSLPSHDVEFTLECSGNRGFPWFIGGVYNARWTGTPLAPILKEAGLVESGVEVVFYGSDEGEEEVKPFLVEPVTMKQNFARSMSIEEATNPNIMLCYAVNGEPLPPAHGFPLRLIAPGWYGIANVKWLKRIEVRSTRFMGKFMAKDYVTVREEKRNGESVWVQSSVGPARINSVPAKVTNDDKTHRIYGAAWGAPIERVEVKIDDADWTSAEIFKGQDSEFSWKFWRLNWPDPSPGIHTITSRSIDKNGNVQPTADDPFLKQKRTYWESNGQLTRTVKIG